MADPSNRADLPPSWLPRADPVIVEPSPRDREIARRVANNRRRKVIMLASIAEDHARGLGMDADTFRAAAGAPSFWKLLCEVAGVQAPKTEQTRADVVDKVCADLVEPYRKLGRG